MAEALSEQLDRFEKTLEEGLFKVSASAGFASEEMRSPDIDAKWDEYIKDYVADAVKNFNDYPDAALGFAAYLGMAVAHRWDEDWQSWKDAPYQAYYGSRGYDNMDDSIVENILRLDGEQAKKVADVLASCCEATLGLIRHEGIEAQTALGFYALVRCYSVMFRIGESIELTRSGYKKKYINR